VTRPSHC